MAFLVPVFTAVASAVGSIGSALGVGGAAAAGATAAGGFSLGTALTLGSTALGVAGTLAQAQAQKKAANYNAAVQEQQAQVEQQKGAARATEISQRTRQKMAGVRAASIESGLELSGSVGDVLDTVNQQGALDSMTALWDSSTRAQGLRNSAELERAKGKSAVTAGYLGAGSSLLTGFSKLYTV
jgi:hypothetical protein